MKKIVNILFATAVVALALVSCQREKLAETEIETKEEVEVTEEAMPTPIHFYATEIETKTVFGDKAGSQYPTLWTDSKGIKISYNKKTSVEATVTPKDGYTKADFATDKEITEASGDSHIFYALSPSSAQASNINTTYYSWRFIIPTTQTPLDGSVDENAQILYAKYDAGASFPTDVPFEFHHLTAYGKLGFSDLSLDGEEEITSIALTASKKWAGQWLYYVATKDSNTEGEVKEPTSGTVGSKTITLNTNLESNIWFACKPVDLSNGGTIDIKVTTNKGVYSKTITFPEGKGNFQAGHVASFTVNMSGISRITPSNVAGIKALYSNYDLSFVATLTDALVTAVKGSNAYLQDESGAILIYTSNHGLSVGDKLNGTISGTITKYQGNYEISGFANSASKTTGNEVTPIVITPESLISGFAGYESKYVRVENLEITADDSNTLSISGNDGLKIRNETGSAITVGSIINVEGVACYYNTNKQVKIFTLSEADKLAVGSVITADDKSVAVGSTVSIGASTNSPATITYSSANTSVATVTSSGVITGVAAGSTTITCSVAASGKYTSTSKVINVTVAAASSIPTPETITFSSLGLENGVQYSDPFNGGHFTITFAGGGNDGKYYTTGSGIRTYGGGTITIASTYNISEVQFTWDGSNAPSDDVADPTGYSTDTKKWTGTSKSIVLTRPSGSGHWRLQSVKVTYKE